MAAASEENLRTYRGNCHCGAFIYEYKSPEITSVAECNCSICYKRGYLWSFPSSPDHFSIVKGDDSTLKVYKFGPETMLHMFCPTCGTGIMAKRPQGPVGMNIAINVHSIQGLNTWTLERKPFDGAAVEPQHEIPKYTGPEPAVDIEGGKLYTGSCHCGAVQLALKSKPIDDTYDERLIECNCSCCERMAYAWVYPKREQVQVHGAENLASYLFNNNIMAKTFCKTCGIPFTNQALDLSQEQLGGLSDRGRAWHARSLPHLPVNMRVLDHFNVKDLKIERLDGYNMIPKPYVNP